MNNNQTDLKKYVLAIDSGSTGIRALLFNHKGEIISRAYQETPPSFPEEGAIEHDPLVLWEALIAVVKKVFESSDYSLDEVASVGITNQRGSFCLVEKETGEPVTNFISWADVRAADTAVRCDNQFSYRLLRSFAGVVGGITKSPMLLTTKMIHMNPVLGIPRLKWLFEQEEVIYRDKRHSGHELYERCKNNEIHFCTLDSWFIYKLTNGKHHYTDVTNASGTSMYNPFELEWNTLYFKIFDIPHPPAMFPRVLDTADDFGNTDPDVFFGYSIPIGASVGDQMAALFGHCCFQPGQTKISQGSGAFVDMTVGSKPKLSKRGLFPLIAWRINGEITYMLEGQVVTAGTLIDWLGEGIGVYDTAQALNEFAAQTEDTEGVIFIPTPSGIGFPYFSPKSRACIFGLSLSTHRRHVCRAVLEGLAMRAWDILEGMQSDTKIKLQEIMVDGGVSKSDIQLQCLADFANVKVMRAPESDMTGTGAAYFAGLSAGFWRNLDELKNLQREYKEFVPKMDPQKRAQKIEKWKKAMTAVLSMNK
ncbi:MAG: glycerol kinase 5 [Promethearchaeota archaeon]